MASRTAIRLGSARPSRAVLHSRRRRRPDLEVLEDRRLLAQIVVNNPTDSPVSGETDLRQAIAAAVSGDAISFDATVFATPQTITLAQANGQLEVETSLTITGPAAGVTISGGGQSGVFGVDNGVTASLSGLTITGGSGSYTFDGRILEAESGGGLDNYGTATLTGCTISGNSFLGVDNNGTATLTDCTFSGDSTGRFAEGVLINGGTATLTDCTFSGNSAGMGSDGTATITDCTFSGNFAGLALGGTATVTGCTISGNGGATTYSDGLPWTFGGGVLCGGNGATFPLAHVTLTGCTISGNSAAFGGGLINGGYGR